MKEKRLGKGECARRWRSERKRSGEKENVLGVGEEQKERVESGEKENVLGVGRYQKEREERGEKENVLGVGEDQKERENSGEKENVLDAGEDLKERGDSEETLNWQTIPSPDLCVGKYVIVKYNSLPYPGYVQDAGQSDLYVECMHRIGKKEKKTALCGLKR